MCSAAPRGLVLQLAPKKALRASSSSGGWTVVPPTASGGVLGEAADPSAGVVPVMAASGAAAALAAGGGADPIPSSVPPVAPTAQGIIPPGPQTGEVIDLDADEAKGTTAMGGGTDAPAAVAGSAAEGPPAPETAAEEATATVAGTSAPIIPVEVAPAAEAEGPAGGTPAGVEEPPLVVAAEGEVAAGIPILPLASEAAPPLGDPAAASVATSVQVPGPSVNPAASGELAKLKSLLDAKRSEHGALRDAVRVVCDGFGVVPEEGSSSLPAHVLGVHRRGSEIAVDALHTGVRMSGGYAAGYSEAELDEIDAAVFTLAEALAKLLEDEAFPPADPPDKLAVLGLRPNCNYVIFELVS
ncbi:fibrous sheath CABYR-binding protein-like [Setaria italica]|uniref:fibrous sheath CABYR-binding protein-like n=1 Tax=Setaria italica TaxID=4555 RepID=UPI0003510205|nr:fibrous sheath CABYR-binding protein-like [Setaria italica]